MANNHFAGVGSPSDSINRFAQLKKAAAISDFAYSGLKGSNSIELERPQYAFGTAIKGFSAILVARAVVAGDWKEPPRNRWPWLYELHADYAWVTPGNGA